MYQVVINDKEYPCLAVVSGDTEGLYNCWVFKPSHDTPVEFVGNVPRYDANVFNQGTYIDFNVVLEDVELNTDDTVEFSPFDEGYSDFNQG